MVRCWACHGPHRASERPECLEKQRAHSQRPDAKERMRAYSQRPEVKEKQRAYNQRPDVKERRRARNSGRDCRLLLKIIENPPADPESLFNEESIEKILGPMKP